MQASEVDGDRHHLGLVAPNLAQAAGRACQVAAAGVRDRDHVGLASVAFLHLTTDLGSKRLYPRDSVRGVEAGVEVAGFLQGAQQHVEQLRADRQFDHLGPVGLAGPGLLDDLGLPDVFGVVDLLNHDAFEALLGGLRGDGRPVVPARCGDHALEALLAGLVSAEGGAARFEAA